MEKLYVPDAGGDTICVYDVAGCYFPPFDIRAIQGLRSVKIYEEDVLLLGFPKSGNHWLWEMIRHLLAGTIQQDELLMASMFMERTLESSYASLPVPRVLTSHGQLHQLSPDVLDKKPKIVNLVRNPKDVAVSLYIFAKKLKLFEYSGKWENFLKSFTETFVYHSWADHVLAWEKVKDEYPDWPILTLHYEDVIEDPFRELKKLCSFLRVEREDSFLKAVMDVCSFNHMQKFKSTNERNALYFRKGQVGDWKNWFTVAQNEWFDEYHDKKMKNCKLKFRYALD